MVVIYYLKPFDFNNIFVISNEEFTISRKFLFFFLVCNKKFKYFFRLQFRIKIIMHTTNCHGDDLDHFKIITIIGLNHTCFVFSLDILCVTNFISTFWIIIFI